MDDRDGVVRNDTVREIGIIREMRENLYQEREKQKLLGTRMSIDQFHCINQTCNIKVVFEEDELII